MPVVAAAFPFVSVNIDTSGLQPVAQRSPGVIAVVGVSNAGTAAVNAPTVVETAAEAVAAFGPATALTKSLALALLQDPRPSRVYGVKVAAGATTVAVANTTAALDSLLALDDLDFVALASIVDPALLVLLKQHVEQASAAGNKRLGVVMVDPAKAKSATYVTEVLQLLHPTGTGPDLQSTVSRMVVVAARGARADDGSTPDVASAAMAAMAGYTPATSIVLKRVRGFSIPPVAQYTSAEIKALSEANVNPLIQPALLVGGGIVFGEGRTFTSDASLLYVDVVRTLDDIDFRLKAGLIRLVGNVGVTRSGLTATKMAVEGILGPLERAGTIDRFGVRIPVLDILSQPDATRSSTDTAIVTTARANRAVDVLVMIVIGAIVHSLFVRLSPQF
jgi:hypothetical protein